MTTAEKLEKTRQDLEKLLQQLQLKQYELETAATDKKRETLNAQIEKLEARIQQKAIDVKKLELLRKKEELAELACEIEDDEFKLIMETLGLQDKASLQRIIDTAHTIINLKSTRLIIAREEKQAEELLRRIVASHPTGWTFNDDVNKRYKFFRIGRLTIILQDTPTYSISFDDLCAWIGLTEAVRFAKVDATALIRKIEEEELKDVSGKPITLEDWENKRTRSVGQPKVVVKEEDDKGREKVLIVKPELLGETVDSLKKLTKLTGHEINPLIKAGIEKIAQIRGFSGEQLQSIPGIGSKRAQKIIDEISELSGGEEKKSEEVIEAEIVED